MTIRVPPWLLLVTLVIESITTAASAYTSTASQSSSFHQQHGYSRRRNTGTSSCLFDLTRRKKQQHRHPAANRPFRRTTTARWTNSFLFATKPDLDQQQQQLENTIKSSSILSSDDVTTDNINRGSVVVTPTPISDAERQLGVWVLFTVPFAWGTFEPAVRYVYAIQPPVPGFVFSVGYYLVAAITLGFLVITTTTLKQGTTSNSNSNTNNSDGMLDVDMTPLGTAVSANSTSLPLRGGAELGMYLFVGNALQVLGLKTVPSDRAAFLLQLTTIFVPLVQSVFAGNVLAVPVRTWIACLIALAGVAVISLDGKQDDLMIAANGSLPPLNSLLDGISAGDFLIVLAAFSYTFHCIRLERFAKETSAIKLAACKAFTETFLCGLLVTSLVLLGMNSNAPDQVSSDSFLSLSSSGSLWSYVQQEGQDIAHFFESTSQQWTSGSLSPAVYLPAIGAVLWTGWVTVAYTIYAQSFGQSRVSPSDANLIYTLQPICTAIFAWLLLGETLGPLGYLGGAIIGFAVYLVVAVERDQKNG